jgi:hypothetical protein
MTIGKASATTEAFLMGETGTAGKNGFRGGRTLGTVMI